MVFPGAGTWTHGAKALAERYNCKLSEDAIKAEALMKETMIVVSEALILREMQGVQMHQQSSVHSWHEWLPMVLAKFHPALHMETWRPASVLHHCKLWFAISYHLMSGSFLPCCLLFVVVQTVLRNSVSSQSQWLFYFAARLTSFQYEIRFPEVEF